ncbi:hypothetical protein BS78_10G131500 [Paspalum vaginatum]|nr:hypothetical protein BS78_10G131500 [Paspalum vaginatum]
MLGELGAEPAAAPAAAHLDRNEVLGSTLPVVSTLCTGQEDYVKEKEGQAVEDVRKKACKVYAESKQEKNAYPDGVHQGQPRIQL